MLRHLLINIKCNCSNFVFVLKMIREVIFMLNGQSGALFVLEGDQFEVCAGIANFSPSEKESIKPLLKIGTNVACIITFIESNQVDSLYLIAVQKSVSKCMAEYQQTLIDIENTILDGSKLLGITGIHSKILPYSLQLEYLKEFVETTKLQAYNCLLIDTVKQFRDHCGIAHIIATFQSIYRDCLQVLHKQLISWLLFGKILDPYNEFFIQVDSSKQHIIIGERIPSCLNINMAQQVLFVGESVVALSEALDLSEEDWDFMRDLQKIPFHEVIDIIQSCRDHMAKRLWKQVTENDRLNRSLNMIRNTFLMKKGDIFAHFIRQTESLLDAYTPPLQIASTQFNLNQKLLNSLKKYLAEEEVEIERLSLRLKADVTNQGWDRVSLEYKSEWPLGVLIFTSETMNTYNMIFRLLLKLRRIHLNLNALWKSNISWNSRTLELRWNLQHVLIHLSQYIQTDVVEVQKSIMDRQMDKCQDFDQFRAAHAQFLVVIAAQTFLHVPAMQACIKDLMDLALRFCQIFQGDEKSSAEIDISVWELNQEFERLMQLVFSLLNGMYQQSSGPSMEPIAQLLLRLDFNYYLTEGIHKKRVNIT